MPTLKAPGSSVVHFALIVNPFAGVRFVPGRQIANAGQFPRVYTREPGTLNNNCLVNLLEMNTTRQASAACGASD